MEQNELGGSGTEEYARSAKAKRELEMSESNIVDEKTMAGKKRKCDSD